MSTQGFGFAANKEWGGFMKSPAFGISKKFHLTKEAPVFTMGSCFAMEIRTALAKRGYKLFPDYGSLEIDQRTQIFDRIPERPFTAHYDTFTMRQEFEAAFGVFSDRNASFWSVKGARANDAFKSPEIFQDPLRKVVYAATLEKLNDLASRVDTIIRVGVAQSDVYVITLGLTEVWRHNLTGRYLCQPPDAGGGGGAGMATFRQSTFQENYDNVKAILDLIFARYPEKRVIISVSPVPLGVTYSDTDIYTANLESKSILRAVAGQVCREYANAIYFPSYEIANMWAGSGKVFEPNGRHVRPTFVDQVIAAFESFFANA